MVAYHEASLGELIEHVAQRIDRFVPASSTHSRPTMPSFSLNPPMGSPSLARPLTVGAVVL